MYSLYVTDFTKNANLYPIQANWCTPAYEGYAFKIELWDEAAQQGPEIQPHEYYEINNVRMKVSAGGYWEGTFSEVRKMRKLDEDELEQEPHLADLLVYVHLVRRERIHDPNCLTDERRNGKKRLNSTVDTNFPIDSSKKRSLTNTFAALSRYDVCIPYKPPTPMITLTRLRSFTRLSRMPDALFFG